MNIAETVDRPKTASAEYALEVQNKVYEGERV
jgi:hypothetical protein